VTEQFASADPVRVFPAALASTAYVPVAVSTGAVLFMTIEPLCPGLRFKDVDESELGQPYGLLELKLNVLEGHPAESLFLTDTL